MYTVSFILGKHCHFLVIVDNIINGRFSHALQLRQAQLAFPSVHLLAGVPSDELVKTHKVRSIMSHPERCAIYHYPPTMY